MKNQYFSAVRKRSDSLARMRVQRPVLPCNTTQAGLLWWRWSKLTGVNGVYFLRMYKFEQSSELLTGTVPRCVELSAPSQTVLLQFFASCFASQLLWANKPRQLYRP